MNGSRRNWHRGGSIALGILLCWAGRAMGQAPTEAPAQPPNQGASQPTAGQSTYKSSRLIFSHPVTLSPAGKAMEVEINRLDSEADIAFEAGRYSEAEDDEYQSLAIGQDAGQSQETLAAILDAEGKTYEAIEAYQKISDAGDVDPRILLPYGLLLLKTGQWAKAVMAYNTALPWPRMGS